jgi:hypothetical protein
LLGVCAPAVETAAQQRHTKARASPAACIVEQHGSYPVKS